MTKKNNVYQLPKKPKQLTLEACEQLQRDMLKACRKIASSHGLSVTDSGLQNVQPRFGFEFAIQVGIPKADGSLHDPEQHLFEALAFDYGFNPEDHGREFEVDGERFRITGLNPRRPKYPINAERLTDRRKFKFAAAMVQIYLENSNKDI